MYQRILLPVDLSDRHGPALTTAAELCQHSGGEIVLVHVVELIPGLGIDEERPFYERLERIARAHLQRLGQRLDEKKVRWRLEIRLGPRVAEVVQSAQQAGADLVVLTTPRPDPDNPTASWGSLGVRVGLVMPCPVLLVR